MELPETGGTVGAHTPGPWKLRRGSDGAEYGSIVGSDGNLVATTGYRCAVGSDEDDANARLIAAAPDLLASCREAMKWPEEDEFGNAIDEAYATPGYRAFRRRLREAVAKASGR